jgi:hypothetical protein
MTSSLLAFLVGGDLQNKKNTSKLSGSFSFFRSILGLLSSSQFSVLSFFFRWKI